MKKNLLVTLAVVFSIASLGFSASAYFSHVSTDNTIITNAPTTVNGKVVKSAIHKFSDQNVEVVSGVTGKIPRNSTITKWESLMVHQESDKPFKNLGHLRFKRSGIEWHIPDSISIGGLPAGLLFVGSDGIMKITK